MLIYYIISKEKSDKIFILFAQKGIFMPKHTPLMTRHTFLKLESLTQIYAQRKKNELIDNQMKKVVDFVEVDFITFDKTTQELKAFRELKNEADYLDSKGCADCSRNDVLIFRRVVFEDRCCDYRSIREAIEKSSFSVSFEDKKKLIEFMGKHQSYHFTENANEILAFMLTLLKDNEKQSKKWYNNILKHLTYECIHLMELTDKQRKENLAQGIVDRRKNNAKKKRFNDPHITIF